MRNAILLVLLLISACMGNPAKFTQDTVQPAKPPLKLKLLEPSFFGETVEVIAIEDVFALTNAQKNDFLTLFNAPENRSIYPNRRLSNYLKDRLAHFNFYSDTLTALEALSKNYGNCLSLAILTKSLADLAKVEINYQLVDTPPIFQKEGDVVLSTLHIRTQLLNPKTERFFFIRGSILIDYFPTGDSRMLRSVDEAEFISMYYRNKAAEAIIQDKNNHAYWLLKKALELTQNNPHAINMMALIHERIGYSDYAENLYKFGLENTQNKLHLLDNYHSLLVRQNRETEAKVIAIKLKQYHEENPFKWIRLGNESYNLRNYSRAITYFKKAKKIAPYLHETYAGIARAQYQLGHLGSALRSFKKAQKKANKKKNQAMYQAKYDMLSDLIAKNSTL